MTRSCLLGTGHYVPERVITTAEIAALVGGDASEIRRKTGIETRRFAAPGQAASDLALEAARSALAAAGRRASEVECIVFSTHSPDFQVPGSGCILGAKLELPGVPAIDLRQQCGGFLHGLSIADHFVRLGTYRCVLVVDAEVVSAGIELSLRGRDAAVAAGDGAGAAIVAPDEGPTRRLAPRILATGLHADGRFARSVMVELPGSAAGGPLVETDLTGGRHLPTLGGFEVVEETYRRLAESLDEALARADIPLDRVALLVVNAGSAQVASLLARRRGIAPDRLLTNLERHGNTAGASVPICLDEALRSERLQPGDHIFLLSFGSGFTWAWGVLQC